MTRGQNTRCHLALSVTESLIHIFSSHLIPKPVLRSFLLNLYCSVVAKTVLALDLEKFKPKRQKVIPVFYSCIYVVVVTDFYL